MNSLASFLPPSMPMPIGNGDKIETFKDFYRSFDCKVTPCRMMSSMLSTYQGDLTNAHIVFSASCVLAQMHTSQHTGCTHISLHKSHSNGVCTQLDAYSHIIEHDHTIPATQTMIVLLHQGTHYIISLMCSKK